MVETRVVARSIRAWAWVLGILIAAYLWAGLRGWQADLEANEEEYLTYYVNQEAR